MKVLGGLIFFLLTAAVSASAQVQDDSSFSLLINSGLSVTHANDPHINRWLEKYGYPAEPHAPTSFNFELAAMPAASRLLYSIKLSTISSGHNLSSFNISVGLHNAFIKTNNFLFFAGVNAGYHSDIIRLNGQLPADYAALASQYHSPLALRRTGLFLEPGLKAFYYPINYHSLQLGIYGGLAYDLYFNSHWGLGYYNNNHGKSSGHFRQLKKPADQLRVSEYGFCLSAGLSLRIHLH
ncbi:MAG: hypothetical protein JST68_20070 [Bacteroidetes bacterium]|nr:hypothetical protein [Bacteroidota bacterium]